MRTDGLLALAIAIGASAAVTVVISVVYIISIENMVPEVLFWSLTQAAFDTSLAAARGLAHIHARSEVVAHYVSVMGIQAGAASVRAFTKTRCCAWAAA